LQGPGAVMEQVARRFWPVSILAATIGLALALV
jgi:hypothetical protein